MMYLRCLALAPFLMGGCAATQLDQTTAERWAFSTPLAAAAAQTSPDADTAKERTLSSAVSAVAPDVTATPPGDPVFQSADQDSGLLSALKPKNIQRTAKSAIGLGPDAERAKQTYLTAEQKFREAAAETNAGQRRKSFLAAAKLYGQAADRWPGSALEEDAMLMVGDSYFFADEYPDANTAYRGLLKRYPQTRHLDNVEARRFKIAQYWLELAEKEHPLSINLTDPQKPWHDSRGAAIRVFDEIRIDDPAGRLADDATMAAANAYFAAGQYLEADEFYTDLRETFLDSEHQFMAHFLGVQAKLRAYQGPDYAGDALDHAAKLIDKIRRQFPDQMEKYAAQLQDMYGKVRVLQAQREIATARFYDRRQEYGAARFYYDIVASKYSDTSLGKDAGERLAALEGQPAEPAQRLAWLANAFPDDDEKPLIIDQPGVYRR